LKVYVEIVKLNTCFIGEVQHNN